MLHITPRYLYEFFCKENFDVLGILERWDLIKVFTIKKKIYPELVKLFYANLEYKNHCIISEVKNIKMAIDQGLFYEFTSLTIDEVELSRKGSAAKDWEDDYNYEIATSQLLKEGTKIKKKLTIGAFELETVYCIIFLLEL